MKRPGSFTLFRLRGISLNIHISLVLLLLYVMAVATAQFPIVVRESGFDPADLTWNPGIWGLLFTLALFVSVALHEFGHALVAQAMGVKVRGITLMMLGGISEMEEIPERPWSEFKLAVIGPVVSLALAGVLELVSRGTTSPDLSLFASWVGGANLVLGIFNLLPAFPLDGGRVLRSAIAARTGNARATRIATSLSKGLAFALGLLGFMSFNILLLMIAFFIYFAASNEQVITDARGALGGLTAADLVMPIPPIDEAASLEDAAQRMVQARTSLLPVRTHDGRPALISSEILQRVPRNRYPFVQVEAALREAPRLVTLDDPAAELLRDAASSPFRALPVADTNGQLRGILRYSDMVEMLLVHRLEVHPTPPRPTPPPSEEEQKRAA